MPISIIRAIRSCYADERLGTDIRLADNGGKVMLAHIQKIKDKAVWAIPDEAIPVLLCWLCKQH